jgi:hypothetical protein
MISFTEVVSPWSLEGVQSFRSHSTLTDAAKHVPTKNTNSSELIYKQTVAGRAGKDKSPCKLHHRENLSKYSLYFLLVHALLHRSRLNESENSLLYIRFC